MPAGLPRSGFLLPLSDSVCCCRLPGDGFLDAVEASGENLAAHRCSNLLWSSSGILAISHSGVFPAPIGYERSGL